MLNLIKYEFIRKYKLFIITIISSLALNLYLLTKGAAGSTLFIAIFPIVIAILYIVDIIKMYSDDLNKKSGFMLFMTPNSGYKIIISKLITAVLEGLTILLIYFVIILLNGAYIIYSTGMDLNLSEIFILVNNLFTGNFGFSIYHVFVFLMAAMIFLIGFLTTVYTAMTIRKSIFSEVKFGGALSFVIFLMINWAISYISNGFYELLNPYYETIINTARVTATELVYILLPICAFSIIQSIGLTFCSGYLLENKINL